MIDGYAHVDMSTLDPLGDLGMRMKNAGVNGVFVIETWDKRNRSCIEKIAAEHLPQFRAAACFRKDEQKYALDLLQNQSVAGIRVRTEDLIHVEGFADFLEKSGKWLVTHAESGIGTLREQLLKISKRYPGLRIYVPHFGWPRQNGQNDPDWKVAMCELSLLPNCIAGLSAMAAFSNEPYPHQDVRQFAIQMHGLFGVDRLMIGSDYPLFPLGMYSQYIALAWEWLQVQTERTSGSRCLEAELFRHEGKGDCEGN